MKLSDYVVQRTQEITKADAVFMLTGGMAMHLDESFGYCKNMRIVPCHHEQAAGIAATSYARMKEVPGIVCVTAGPGALNAVTPCCGAYFESVPLIFLSGQVSRANGRQGHPVRQRGIQEVDIIEIVKSITKYAVQVNDPDTIRYHLEKALYLATSGRPGPVWLDIPIDVQGADVDPDKMEAFSIPKKNMQLLESDEKRIQKIADGLSHAKRPLLVLGQGVRISGAAPFAKEFIESMGIPFQTSWNGMDLIDNDHPLSFGRSNVFGSRYANILFQNSDYVVFIGCRLGIQHTGYNVEAFARGAHTVMVDLDKAEMEKPGMHIDDKLVIDANLFMHSLLRHYATEKTNHEAWITECDNLKKRFPIAPSLEDIKDQTFVQPQYFVDELAKQMPSDALFPFGSSGEGHTITGGIFRCKEGQRVFTCKGLAAMGYGIPCVVGAGIAFPDRPAFTLVGEGGLQLNIQEFQTALTQHLTIKVIVFNNGGYHSMHMTQTSYFGQHFVGAGPESGVTFPPLPGVAKLYQMEYFKVHDNKEVDSAIQQFIDCKKSAFLEVFVDPTKPIDPKCASMKLPDGRMVSRPLEDMVPLMDRKELQSVMDIPLLG